MDTCTYMAEFLCYSPETITKLFISYTPIQNIKFQKKFRWFKRGGAINELISSMRLYFF